MEREVLWLLIATLGSAALQTLGLNTDVADVSDHRIDDPLLATLTLPTPASTTLVDDPSGGGSETEVGGSETVVGGPETTEGQTLVLSQAGTGYVRRLTVNPNGDLRGTSLSENWDLQSATSLSGSSNELPDDTFGTVASTWDDGSDRLTTLPDGGPVEEAYVATAAENEVVVTAEGDTPPTLPPGEDTATVFTTVQDATDQDTLTDGENTLWTVTDDVVSATESVTDGGDTVWTVIDDASVTETVTDDGHTVRTLPSGMGGEDSATETSEGEVTVPPADDVAPVTALDDVTTTLRHDSDTTVQDDGETDVTSVTDGSDFTATVRGDSETTFQDNMVTDADSVTDTDDTLSAVQDGAVTAEYTVTDGEVTGVVQDGVTDGYDVTSTVTDDVTTVAVIDQGEAEAAEGVTKVSHDLSVLGEDLVNSVEDARDEPPSSTPPGDTEAEETLTVETDHNSGSETQHLLSHVITSTSMASHPAPVGAPPTDTQVAIQTLFPEADTQSLTHEEIVVLDSTITTENSEDDDQDREATKPFDYDGSLTDDADSYSSDYDLIVETVISTATVYIDEELLQHLGTSRRLPRTVSADLRATPAQLNDVEEATDQYRGFHRPSPAFSTFMTVVDSHYPSELRKSNRKSDPEPDIDDIIKGIVQLLGGNVKVTAAEAPNTRLTTFGNLEVSSTRINNRGPPRLTHLPYGVLNSPIHTRIPIRPPVTPPANLPNLRPLPGRPQYVANTRPPFLAPLPPSLASRPPPPLQRPYATGIPLPIDLLPNSEEIHDTNPEITVNPIIPGFPEDGDEILASRPPTGESPHAIESSQPSPTTPHPAPASLTPPPPRDVEQTDTFTSFTTITSTTSLGTSSSETGLVSQLLSDAIDTSTSSVSDIAPETSTTVTASSSTSTTAPDLLSDFTLPDAITPPPPHTHLQPSMLDSTSATTSVLTDGQEPQPTSTVATTSSAPSTDGFSLATSTVSAPTPLLSIPRHPTPSYRPHGPPLPSLSHPRPGVVLDDSEYRPGQIITGTVVPYDVGGPGDIFDVTVSAHQGFGPPIAGPHLRPRPPATNLERPFIGQGNAQGPLVTTPAQGNEGFVSIDGRKTYFDLFPTSATHTQALLQQPQQQQTVGTGVGVVIPEADLPQDGGPPQNHGGYYPQPPVPQPTRPPTRPPPTRPTPRPRPQQPSTPTPRPVRKPYNRRPTQPSIRIDTCIVGDDSTCQEQLGEVCRTEEEVSSCYCKPGTARRRPRTPCKRMISLRVSLKVDRVGDQRIVWGGNYDNPESQEYRLLEWEARHAISNAMSKTPLSTAYLGNTVHKFYSLGGKVIVNSTINLEDLPSTRNRNIRHTLQRQMIQVIQSHANNIGDSALWVDGPLNPIPDVSDVNECNEGVLHDCHVHANCVNEFGTFTCRCLPGYTDRFSDDPEQVGRRCESCSSDYCNKRGECHIQDGHKVCQCRGSYYGTRCEIDGEVLGVAVGASVAAVVIIILTLIFLCMWSRRWKAQDRKTEVLARGAALGGFAVNVQHKGTSSAHQYGASLDDRMRWAQLADTLSNQNIYAQPEQLRGVSGPSAPPTTAATPTPLFQQQRQVAASSSGYASLGTLGSTTSPQYGHQYPPQQFGLQHLNPVSHLASMQQQQQQQHHKQSAFGAHSTYGQYGPASFNMSQGGVSRAPTLGARTPVPLHDVTGASTIGPMGGGTVAPSGLESSEDELDRPYHLPRPKSRVSLGVGTLAAANSRIARSYNSLLF